MPTDHPQDRGLAASRGAQQHYVLPVVDVETDTVHRNNFAEVLGHLAQLQAATAGRLVLAVAGRVRLGGLRGGRRLRDLVVTCQLDP